MNKASRRIQLAGPQQVQSPRTGDISLGELHEIPGEESRFEGSIIGAPIVSVLMVTYNHDKYVSQAIEGVISQRCQFAIELILGEDCSTDHTREICVAYQKKYPHIIRLVTSEQNVGGYANLMRLWARARGKYIAICDGDDYWCSTQKLDLQVARLEKECESVLSFGACGVVRGFSEAEGIALKPRRIRQTYSLEDHITKISIPSCTALFRAGLVNYFPRWYERAGIGDWPLQLFHLKFGTSAYINMRLATYRQHRGGTWSQSEAMRRWELENCVITNLNDYFNGRYRNLFNIRRSKAYLAGMERQMVADGRYGITEYFRYVVRAPVNPFLSGATFWASLAHVGFPKAYSLMKRWRLLKREL